jgi:hypothetical protein
VSTCPQLLANGIKCGYNKMCERKRVIRETLRINAG